MGSKIEQKRQRKESVNWKIEQYKLFIFNNKKKIEKYIHTYIQPQGTVEPYQKM